MISQTRQFEFVDRGFESVLCLIPGWATDERIFSKLELDYNYLVCKGSKPFSFEKDLLNSLDENSLPSISFLALSLGGFLAAEFAVNNPGIVDEVSLVGVRQKYPIAGLLDIEAKLKKSKKGYLYKFYEDCFFGGEASEWQSFKKGLLKEYVEDLRLNELLDGLNYLRQAELSASLLKNIKHLKFLHSSSDKIAPMDEVLELKSNIPNSCLVLMDGFGHIPFLNPMFKGRFLNG
jgi:pimeloyl-ACP methyl ester carboxylesterase